MQASKRQSGMQEVGHREETAAARKDIAEGRRINNFMIIFPTTPSFSSTMKNPGSVWFITMVLNEYSTRMAEAGWPAPAGHPVATGTIIPLPHGTATGCW